MLHGTAEDCSKTLTFNLSSALSRENLQGNIASGSPLKLLNISNESLVTPNTKYLNTKENLLISFAVNGITSDLLPASNSKEKLSWTFFDQVDTLDNQLRSDVVREYFTCSRICFLITGLYTEFFQRKMSPRTFSTIKCHLIFQFVCRSHDSFT